jgi:hypothetical protein
VKRSGQGREKRQGKQRREACLNKLNLLNYDTGAVTTLVSTAMELCAGRIGFVNTKN